MKTSNKLLLGLILAFFLIATIFMGVVKYYHVTTNNKVEQNTEKNTAELSFQQEEADSSTPIFFPVALLQPLQLR